MPPRTRPVSQKFRSDDSAWKDYPRILRWSGGALLQWDLVILAIMVFLLLAWFQKWWDINTLPNPIGGMLPLVAPWAGALGGVAISIVGLASHFGDWGPRVDKKKRAVDHPGYMQRIGWNAWHVSRPFVGALFGSVAAMIVVFVFGTVGATEDGRLDPSPLGTAAVFAAAFIVGYRDGTFRDLAERVIDTLFGPGVTSDRSVSFDLSESNLDLGDTKINSHIDKVITITNNSTRLLRIDKPAVSGTGFSLPGANRITLGANATEEIKVRFAPTSAGDAEGVLVVKGGGREKTVSLKAKGVS